MTAERCDPALLRESLERIARALGQPVSTFFDGSDPATRHAETVILVQAFEGIADADIRARCLAFVNAEAERG